MQVKARAVIVVAGRLAVAEERRVGQRHLTLAGGRPDRGETLQAALTREVREELALDVAVGPLMYVAEVVSGNTLQQLNLVFLAEPVAGDLASLTTVGPADPDRARVMPPILDEVFADLAGGWPPPPRFLGNVYRANAGRRS